MAAFAAIVFAESNGHEFLATPNELVKTTLAVAEGKMAVEALAIWYRQRPRSVEQQQPRERHTSGRPACPIGSEEPVSAPPGCGDNWCSTFARNLVVIMKDVRISKNLQP